MYANGLGVEQDYLTAADWYRKAADQGNVDAQYNLSVVYSDGLGVSKNSAEAQKWLELCTPSSVLDELNPALPDGQQVSQSADPRARKSTLIGLLKSKASRLFTSRRA